MLTPDSFYGLANKDFSITYYIISGFVLLCVTPLLLRFTTNIQQIFGCMAEVIGCIYLPTTHVFGTFVPMVHFVERNQATTPYWTMTYGWEYRLSMATDAMTPR